MGTFQSGLGRAQQRFVEQNLFGCERPCVHAAAVPAVEVVHELEGAPDSVLRQSSDLRVVQW